jgi:hypothetical protein
MLIFNLTVHHIWGRVLAKFQGARAVAYVDDGYIKAKMSETLQVTQETIFDVAHGFINATPQLTQLSGEISLDSFHPDDFVDIGVSIVTDTL